MNLLTLGNTMKLGWRGYNFAQLLHKVSHAATFLNNLHQIGHQLSQLLHVTHSVETLLMNLLTLGNTMTLGRPGCNFAQLLHKASHAAIFLNSLLHYTSLRLPPY